MADEATTVTPTPAAPAAAPSNLIQVEQTAAEAEALKDGIGDTNEEALQAQAAAAEKAKADAEAAAAADVKAKADEAAAAAAATQRQAEEAAARAAATAKAADIPEPKPPVDFDAEYAKLEKAYDDGDLTEIQMRRKMNELGAQQAAHATELAHWKSQKSAADANAATNAQTSWDAAQLVWQGKHADFLTDAARVKVMSDAIPLIEKLNPGISNEALLEEAYTYACVKTRYVEPANLSAAELEARRVAALQAREDKGGTPATLATVPAAGSHAVGNTEFAKLDGLGIVDMENVMARMTPQQRDAYLMDAPGARSTGRE